MLLQMVIFDSFLSLGNTPESVCLCVIFLSQSSGHLGCFHVLAITNSAVVNIGVHISY